MAVVSNSVGRESVQYSSEEPSSCQTTEPQTVKSSFRNGLLTNEDSIKMLTPKWYKGGIIASMLYKLASALKGLKGMIQTQVLTAIVPLPKVLHISNRPSKFPLPSPTFSG